MLGFTTRDHVHVVWGDSDVAPPSGQWLAGKTITIQGAAVCAAAAVQAELASLAESLPEHLKLRFRITNQR